MVFRKTIVAAPWAGVSPLAYRDVGIAAATDELAGPRICAVCRCHGLADIRSGDRWCRPAAISSYTLAFIVAGSSGRARLGRSSIRTRWLPRWDIERIRLAPCGPWAGDVVVSFGGEASASELGPGRREQRHDPCRQTISRSSTSTKFDAAGLRHRRCGRPVPSTPRSTLSQPAPWPVLQQANAAAGNPIQIWLTLPVPAQAA